MRQINVVTVGGSGVGKTVYLAALHNSLCVRKFRVGRAGLHAEVPRRVGNRLRGLYLRISDPEKQDWGDHTDRTQSSDVRFTVCADSLRGSYPMVEVSYVDYAGEFVTDDDQVVGMQAGRATWFDERLEAADVLLGFIDGQRVLNLLRDPDSGRGELRRQMHRMLWALEENRTANAVHLVITKWDLLQDAGFTLREVKEALKKDNEFARALRYQVDGSRIRSGRVVRLIPVSAIGKGFACQDEHGHMVKIRGAAVRPYNVVVPLYLALADVVEHVVRSRQRGRGLRGLRNRLRTRREDVKRLSGEAVDKWMPGTDSDTESGRVVAKTFLDTVVDWSLREEQPDPMAEIAKVRVKGARRDRKEAFQHAVNEIVDELLSYKARLDHPEDDLLVVPDDGTAP